MNCTTACHPETKQTKTTVFKPRVEIWETPEAYFIEADVPGATPGGVEIQHEGGRLDVRAKVAPRGSGEAKPRLQEYEVGDFHRTFNIGEDVAGESVAASLNDGVLRLTLPKTPAAQPRRIPVAAI